MFSRTGHKIVPKPRQMLFFGYKLPTVTEGGPVVMDNGRIVQQGHHNALIHTTGVYRRLWEREQAAGQLEGLAS